MRDAPAGRLEHLPTHMHDRQRRIHRQNQAQEAIGDSGRAAVGAGRIWSNLSSPPSSMVQPT